jgi:hypothetical protein
MKTLSRFKPGILVALLVSILSGPLVAADKSATGDWKWAITTANGAVLEPTAKLKQDGEKLSGTVSFRESEMKIDEGKIKGDDISFKVFTDRDGRKVTMNFNGKLSGDSIKGKLESDWSGDSRTLDWNATREGATASAAGTWKWSFPGQNGDSIDSVLKLKQEGTKLTGKYTNQFGDSEILDGKLEGENLSFRVERERDGNKFVIKYSGKLSGDTIKGQSAFNFNGEDRSRDWEAKRSKE